MSNATFTLHHTRDRTEILLETIVIVVVFLIGAIANPLVGYVIWKNKKLHNLHNTLTINLIITDSLATFLCMPPLIVTFATGKWLLGQTVCHAVGFLSSVFGISCLWTIMWLSISRLLMLLRPRIYAVIVMPKHMTGIIILIWTMALFTASIAHQFGEYTFKSKFAVCFLLFRNIAGLVAFLVPFVILPLTGIFFATAAIFIRIRKLTRNDGQGTHKEEKAVANSYILLVIVYIVCYLPVFIVEVEYTHDKKTSMHHVFYTIATLLAITPFSIKTFLNVLTKKEFRREMYRFFGRTNRVTVHSCPNIQRAWQQNMLNTKKKDQQREDLPNE